MLKSSRNFQETNQIAKYPNDHITGKTFCGIVVEFYHRKQPYSPLDSSFIQSMNNLDVNLIIENEHLTNLSKNLKKFFNDGFIYSGNIQLEKYSHINAIKYNIDNLVDLEVIWNELERMKNFFNVGQRSIELSRNDRSVLKTFQILKDDSSRCQDELKQVNIELNSAIEKVKSLGNSKIDFKAQNFSINKSEEDREETENSIKIIEKQIENLKRFKNHLIEPTKYANIDPLINCLLVDKGNFRSKLQGFRLDVFDIEKIKCFSFLKSKKLLKLNKAIEKYAYTYRNIFIVILDEYDEIEFNLKQFDNASYKGMNFVIFTVGSNLDAVRIGGDLTHIKGSRFSIMNETNAVQKLKSEIDKLKLINDESSRLEDVNMKLGLAEETLLELKRKLEQRTVRETEHAKMLNAAVVERNKTYEIESEKFSNRVENLEREKRLIESRKLEIESRYRQIESRLSELQPIVISINIELDESYNRALNTPIEDVEFNRKFLIFQNYLKILRERREFIESNLKIMNDFFQNINSTDDIISFRTGNQISLEEFLNFLKLKYFHQNALIN